MKTGDRKGGLNSYLQPLAHGSGKRCELRKEVGGSQRARAGEGKGMETYQLCSPRA